MISCQKLMTIPELAILLNVSKAKAYRMAQSGDIPVIRFGKCVRVRREVVDEILKVN